MWCGASHSVTQLPEAGDRENKKNKADFNEFGWLSYRDDAAAVDTIVVCRAQGDVQDITLRSSPSCLGV